MGLDAVTQEIIDEAEAEADQIVRDAEQEADEIVNQAEQEAEEIREAAREEVAAEIEQLRQKELSAARMQAQQAVQQARQAVLDQAFDRFHDAVDDLDQDEERALLEQALDRLSGRVDIGTVRTREEHSDLAADYGDVEALDGRGAVVASADGSRRFDLTFDTVADRVVEDSRQAVFEVLFEE